MTYLLFILFLIGGYILGRLYQKEPVGTLRIDTSDPDDGPYMFLELKTDPSNIMNEKYVTLKVNTENFITPN